MKVFTFSRITRDVESTSIEAETVEEAFEILKDPETPLEWDVDPLDSAPWSEAYERPADGSCLDDKPVDLPADPEAPDGLWLNPMEAKELVAAAREALANGSFSGDLRADAAATRLSAILAKVEP